MCPVGLAVYSETNVNPRCPTNGEVALLAPRMAAAAADDDGDGDGSEEGLS